MRSLFKRKSGFSTLDIIYNQSFNTTYVSTVKTGTFLAFNVNLSSVFITLLMLTCGCAISTLAIDVDFQPPPCQAANSR